MKLKELLWKLGIINENTCPMCKQRLTTTGYKPYYECKNCGWGKE